MQAFVDAKVTDFVLSRAHHRHHFVGAFYLGKNTLHGLEFGLMSVAEVLRASNIGSPVTVSGATSAPGRAYLHAARRLCGEALPMTIPSDRKGLLDKLFGRRAA
jgi:septum formation inhibitor-activating ATPase MinD